jgi:hypothetical protein
MEFRVRSHWKCYRRLTVNRLLSKTRAYEWYKAFKTGWDEMEDLLSLVGHQSTWSYDIANVGINNKHGSCARALSKMLDSLQIISTVHPYMCHSPHLGPGLSLPKLRCRGCSTCWSPPCCYYCLLAFGRAPPSPPQLSCRATPVHIWSIENLTLPNPNSKFQIESVLLRHSSSATEA